MLKRLFLGFAFILIAGVGFTTNQSQAAGTIARLSINGASLIQCAANVIEGSYQISAYDESGAVINNFSGTEYYITSNGGIPPQSTGFTSGGTHNFYLGLGIQAMTYAEVYVVSNENPVIRSQTYRIQCDGTVLDLGGAVTLTSEGEEEVIVTDGRLNFAHGDLVNVLYARSFGGQLGISVYGVDSDGDGYFVGHFGYALFEPYLDNPPAENVWLGRVDQSSLYALTTGEFQIVIEDPEEVKLYTIIFSAFPISNIYFG